jgi:hypothetical protein
MAWTGESDQDDQEGIALKPTGLARVAPGRMQDALLVLDSRPKSPQICGHVVACRVPLPEANRAPTDQGSGSPAHDWRRCQLHPRASS